MARRDDYDYGLADDPEVGGAACPSAAVMYCYPHTVLRISLAKWGVCSPLPLTRALVLVC